MKALEVLSEMILPYAVPRIRRLMAIAACAVIVGGCAGLPRIDPTGERVFIWPQQQPQVVVPTIGNAPVPPVYTDTVFPSPSLTPVSGTGIVGVPPGPQDTLSITPQRVLAPVGSEVILKAGLCTSEQFLLTKTRVDWMIARESAGEFISLGGRGWLEKPLLPWNKPKKIDNQYATGYSAAVPQILTRGTQDTRDDVQVEAGEAWVSITSPVEGTSHITAMTPEIEAWSQRRATATIYWVDVQWSFPPVSVSAGGSHVLTTTVRRQTDGTALEGWVVRYEVAGGAGALSGPQSDQVVEVRTDANGKASIDVTPTGEGGNTTQIKTQLVRPEHYRNSNAPQLIVANGTTTINWGGAGSTYMPPPDDLGGLPPSDHFVPSTSVPATPPPAQPIQTRKPKLELEVRGDTEAQVGGVANFEFVIRNVGDADATGIEMLDRFDLGFSHDGDNFSSQQISKPIMQTIAPGGSITEKFWLNVLQVGKLSHTVTVSCKGGAPVSKQVSVNAIQPAVVNPPPLPVSPDVVPGGTGTLETDVVPGAAAGTSLAVGISVLADPGQIRAGTRTDFQIVVANRAATPDEQVTLVVTFPPDLVPDVSGITNNASVSARQVGNEVHFQPVARIEGMGRLDFRIPVSSTQPGVKDISAMITSRNVIIPITDRKSVTILSR